MPKVIHKFELSLGNKTGHMMDPNAKIVACGNQGELFIIWAELDAEAPKTNRSFMTVGTGWEVPAAGVYLGTVLFRGGHLVFHAYEITEGAR